MGILYIVSTPIGNLGDISLRAIETLQKVDLILAEDTRRTGILLKSLKIKKNLLSFYEHNELARIPQVIDFLKRGQNLALVSDAGTPTISDPGFKLIREAITQGLKIESIPGASAALAALVVSGLPTDKFIFLGYLPKKQGKATKIIKQIADLDFTIILFESPKRLLRNLKLLKDLLGNKSTVVARELTKLHEEYLRGDIEDIIEHFKKNPIKGEITLIIH